MVECYHFEHIINHLSFFKRFLFKNLKKKGVGINFVYFLCEDFFFALKIVHTASLLPLISDGSKSKFGTCC